MASPFLPAGATTGDSGGELSSGDDSGDVESLQSPETEASGSLAELFEKAAAHLQGLVQVASREQLLYLYARYKQVKVGNCNTPKPSFFDFEGKQKWEAWKALGDSSPSQAMQEYIAEVKKLDPGWNPQSPEKKGKEANTGFGGPVVSSLYHEEIIREEDKNIFDYCRENNIDHVTKVIKSKNVDVNMKDEEGRALLHWACDRGHKELVTVLLQYRADINCQVRLMKRQLFKKIVVKFAQHKIHPVNHFKVYSSLAFIQLTVLCDRHYFLVSHFHYPRRKPCTC
uniref:Acyl-CoA-binding domain-containing protein 6 n=1 Tax=Ursus americanus TaxID=9643 RepID=A0A452QYL3_URSAM